MRRVIAISVRLVKEIFTDNRMQEPRTLVGHDKETPCDECDCDCYECRGKQAATA
jgi:hypothetical protein